MAIIKLMYVAVKSRNPAKSRPSGTGLISEFSFQRISFTSRPPFPRPPVFVEATTLSGEVDSAAESILRSPDIDLTGIAGAQLEFAAAYDFNLGDTVEVRARKAGTDALLGTILPLSPPITSGWTDLGPFDLSIADDSIVYLEFFYKGTDARFIGWYIDDILIRE